MIQAKAAILAEAGKDVEVVDIQIGEIAPDDVIIDVAQAASVTPT